MDKLINEIKRLRDVYGKHPNLNTKRVALLDYLIAFSSSEAGDTKKVETKEKKVVAKQEKKTTKQEQEQNSHELEVDV